LELGTHFIRRHIAILSAVCLAASTPALAQSTYGSINGSVTDPSAAASRGAEVEVINSNRNVTSSAFGLISQSQLQQQDGARPIQMMLRFQFQLSRISLAAATAWVSNPRWPPDYFHVLLHCY
jgi:hypothetical protein